VPLHFTAFHPDFKLQNKPPTPPETLHRARSIAIEAGLHYVYEGNIVTDAGSTFCPQCNLRVIRRSWHKVEENLLMDGKCPRCSGSIPGVWEKSEGGLFQIRCAEAGSAAAGCLASRAPAADGGRYNGNC
jgi:pyruvate formate lyase activating enzyme